MGTRVRPSSPVCLRGDFVEETTMVYDEHHDFWECQKCGLAWQFNDGGPEENEMNYCPKCGRRIKEDDDE